ncbi:hypothetical protein HSX11_20960 [Oxalobacteraceae bacterium]|nr:hypothetical protein [Oxalobacteraceae bacterium]
MPHEAITSKAASAKVHLVRLDGYLDGAPDNAARLAQLKQDVAQCVAEHRQGGYASNAPSVWPDFLQSLRKDSYSASNRSISYSRGVAYLFNPMDCSLRENVSWKAELVSSKGICFIDLKQKTAKGVCDAGGHSSALARPMPAPAASQGTGRKKTILGIDCEVWNQHPGLGGTACLARGASFQPASSAGNPAESGMELEVDTQFGFKMKAVTARLDADVDARVFTPYVNAGFDIKGGMRK